jgi:hypothetical protein
MFGVQSLSPSVVRGPLSLVHCLICAPSHLCVKKFAQFAQFADDLRLSLKLTIVEFVSLL